MEVAVAARVTMTEAAAARVMTTMEVAVAARVTMMEAGAASTATIGVITRTGMTEGRASSRSFLLCVIRYWTPVLNLRLPVTASQPV